MELTTVASAIHALSFDQRNQAYEQGGRFSHNRAEMIEITTAAARTLGEAPSFDQWAEYAVQWKDGYMHDNPDNTGNAADAAWTRFAKTLDELFGLTKPKSTSKAAEKKASEREAKTAQLLEKYEDTTAHELRAQLEKVYTALAKNPENKDLKKAQKEVSTVLKAKTSEENKAHGEELKRLRGEVREKVSKCTDIERLEAVLEILDEYTDVAYVLE